MKDHARAGLSFGHFAPFCAVVIWTGNTLVSKTAVGVIAPESITLYRVALAWLLIAPFVGPKAWQARAVIHKHWWQFVILGGLGTTIYQFLSYLAVHTTTAVNSGVIQALIPLFATMFAAAIARETVRAHRIVAAGVSLFGLAYMTTAGHPLDLFSGELHVGDGLMLIAALIYALYSALLRRWQIPLSLWVQVFVQLGCGMLVLLPIWLVSEPSPITVENVWLVLYASIATSLVAQLFWMIGVAHWGAARSSIFLNLQPPFVAVGAVLLLGESVHLYHLIGGGLTLLGASIGLRERLLR